MSHTNVRCRKNIILTLPQCHEPQVHDVEVKLKIRKAFIIERGLVLHLNLPVIFRTVALSQNGTTLFSAFVEYLVRLSLLV